MTVAELHLTATVFMVGLIVFVQIVQYPLMGAVDSASFTTYEREHTIRTGWIVMPAMLIELTCAVWLVAVPPAAELRWVAWMGAALLAIIWLSTALVQAPAHRRLLEGFDEGVHRRLVRTNWVRTGAWVARIPVALAFVTPVR